jgi:hypothetical protein
MLVWKKFIMEHWIREMFASRQKQVKKRGEAIYRQAGTITFIPD